ncbi:MAG TPA: YcxB family protein [Pyrinomonadaceae bacterium]|nr:YcxB family protein [Pyrinomonadaceae bacterium]
MEKTISLRFKYTEEEYLAATRLYLMRSADIIIRLAICSLYAIGCIFLFTWLGFASQVIPLFIVVALFPFIMGFLLLFVIPRQRFRSDPKFRDEYLMQFSDDGIHFKTAQVDSLLQWSLYNKVLENDRFYLLVYGKNMISVIPKRAFASPIQEAAFGEMLKRNLPAYANAKRLAAHKAHEPEKPYTLPTNPPDWR